MIKETKMEDKVGENGYKIMTAADNNSEI